MESEEYLSKKLMLFGLPTGMPSIIARQTIADKFTELGIETGNILVPVLHNDEGKEIGTNGSASVIVGAKNAKRAIDELNGKELFEGFPIAIAEARPYAPPVEDEQKDQENEGPGGEGRLN